MLFAPWGYLAVTRMSTWSEAGPFELSFFLHVFWTVLPLGVSSHVEDYTPLTLAFLLIPLLGLALLASSPKAKAREATRREAWGSLLLILCLLVPLVVVYLLSVPRGKFYTPQVSVRYLLILAPTYYLLLAWSLILMGRRSLVLAGLCGLFVLTTFGYTLRGYYADRRLGDDYQTLVGYIKAYQQDGDAILLHTDQQWPVFIYHYPGQRPWYGVPYRSEMTPEKVDQLLSPILGRHAAVWLVVIGDALARDPYGHVEAWLEGHAQKVADLPFGDKRLALYSKTPRDLRTVPPTNLSVQYPLSVDFDAGLRPEDFAELSRGAQPEGLVFLGYDQAITEYRTGDVARLVTYWQATAVMERDYAAALALVDGKGEVIKEMVQPLGGDYPTSRWRPGDIVRGEYDFTITSTIPSGGYSFQLRLVDQSTGQPVGEEGPPFGKARVIRTKKAVAASQPSIQHPMQVNLGDKLLFLGYDLGRELTVQPGDTLCLTLYWQALEEMETSYVVFTHLLGQAYNPVKGNYIWGQVDSVPLGGTYPTTGWARGEIVADQYHIIVQPDAPLGEYQLEIGLYDRTTGQRLPVLDESGLPSEDRVLLEKVWVCEP